MDVFFCHTAKIPKYALNVPVLNPYISLFLLNKYKLK